MAESNLPTTGEELDVKNEFLDTGEKKQQGKTWLWWFRKLINCLFIKYLAPPIILSFSGARACVELCLYTEVRSWLRMGLDVSFNECFKRDTRCYAKINTFPTDSSTHKASGVLLQCSEQFKEAKIILRSSFDYSTKLFLKEEVIVTNSQSLCCRPLIFVSTRASPTRPGLN